MNKPRNFIKEALDRHEEREKINPTQKKGLTIIANNPEEQYIGDFMASLVNYVNRKDHE